ncbi:type II secretory pathway, ATPase PulE/Tfp pilus assembly pathway, ATPase PilB [Candidatus Magnetoovum chiemensis]|nr:type II secretory pathway, ATPase PulE/Tfp pilus assembly pathway, ATPase PilB [Candidatus Magnetoovum chiemensis]
MEDKKKGRQISDPNKKQEDIPKKIKPESKTNDLSIETPKEADEAADRKIKIGDLMLQSGLITKEQLETALDHQKGLYEYKPLGEICLDLQYISRIDLQRFLRENKRHMFLGELLVNMNVINQQQLDEAFAVQQKEKKRLGKILIEQNIISEGILVNALSMQLGIPKIIPRVDIIDGKLMKRVNINFLRKYEFIPAFDDEDGITVIMADPLNSNTIRTLESFFNKTILPAVATTEDINKAISLYFQKLEFSQVEESYKNLIIGDTNLSVSTDTIVGLFNFIVTTAIKERASDIHIEPLEGRIRVRYRIDGVLQHITDLPYSKLQPLTTRIKVLCGLDITERRRHQDGRIQARIKDKDLDLRVSSYVSSWGECIVIRILDKSVTIVDMDSIGFNPYHNALYKELLKNPSGVVIVTGPTGSGKTSTLYASLQHLNNIGIKIITVEDPVEYTLDGIIHGKLDPGVNMSFMDFIKSMMRQDPDILMIGEIRDETSASAAIQAALTGHKVFTTFHTEDSTGALLRLMEMGIDTFLISTTVVSVISQRLVRRVCNVCRIEYTPTKEETYIFNSIHSIDRGGIVFYKGRGCHECNYTGYRGRMAIHEILVVNDDIRDAILAKKPSGQIRNIARQNSRLITLREDGFYKCVKGITNPAEIARVVFFSDTDSKITRPATEIMGMCEQIDLSLLRSSF